MHVRCAKALKAVIDDINAKAHGTADNPLKGRFAVLAVVSEGDLGEGRDEGSARPDVGCVENNGQIGQTVQIDPPHTSQR